MQRYVSHTYASVLERLIYEELENRPFPRNHQDLRTYQQLTMQYHVEVELACFLIERGYLNLYQRIGNALENELYDLPEGVSNRLETVYTNYSMNESNESFMNDHKKRERGDSAADRMDEIITAYPLAMATKKDIEACPKCVICQYEIRKRQHIRRLCDGCTFHRACIDQWLMEARTCPICRGTKIKAT